MSGNELHAAAKEGRLADLRAGLTAKDAKGTLAAGAPCAPLHPTPPALSLTDAGSVSRQRWRSKTARAPRRCTARRSARSRRARRRAAGGYSSRWAPTPRPRTSTGTRRCTTRRGSAPTTRPSRGCCWARGATRRRRTAAGAEGGRWCLNMMSESDLHVLAQATLAQKPCASAMCTRSRHSSGTEAEAGAGAAGTSRMPFRSATLGPFPWPTSCFPLSFPPRPRCRRLLPPPPRPRPRPPPLPRPPDKVTVNFGPLPRPSRASFAACNRWKRSLSETALAAAASDCSANDSTPAFWKGFGCVEAAAPPGL